jgi:hypothetical protein
MVLDSNVMLNGLIMMVLGHSLNKEQTFSSDNTLQEKICTDRELPVA